MNKIIIMRGTTPTFAFNLPFDQSLVKEGYISFEQDDEMVLDKKAGDPGCRVENGKITATLTQEETLSFTADRKMRVQTRILSTSDEALASRHVEAYVLDVIKDGVIGSGTN